MSDSVIVSDEFMEFYGKEADAVAAAQQAEASTGNVPFDIGVSGTCIVKSIEFGKSKDKEVEDPQNKSLKILKKGHPSIKMVFQVIDHKDHSGDTFQKMWFLWENDTTSRVDNYKRFLDDCEKRMGLTREIREDPNFTPKVLADFFTSGNPLVTIDFRVVENAKNTYDGGKEIYLSIPKEIIAGEAGLVPGKTHTSTPTPPINSVPSTFKVGQVVKYLEMDWTIETTLGEKVVLTAPGVESKIVRISQLG